MDEVEYRASEIVGAGSECCRPCFLAGGEQAGLFAQRIGEARAAGWSDTDRYSRGDRDI